MFISTADQVIIGYYKSKNALKAPPVFFSPLFIFIGENLKTSALDKVNHSLDDQQ